MTDGLDKTAQGGSEESTTRQRIVEAAQEEFAKYGLDGARVDRIAQRASVNKAMLYYHFQSKENLYETVLKDYFSMISTRIHEKLASAESLEQAITGIAEMHIGVMKTFPNLRPIILRELAEPHGDLLDWVAKTIGHSDAKVAKVALLKEMEAGAYRQIDMRQAMTSFVCMSLGYHILAPIMDRVWNVTDREAFIEERKTAIVDLFLYGVRAR